MGDYCIKSRQPLLESAKRKRFYTLCTFYTAKLETVNIQSLPTPTFTLANPRLLFQAAHGFQQNGGKCVFSSEWDKDAAKTYYYNFGEHPFGDIQKIDPKTIPDFDVLLAGFPCQPFSIIGDREGFNHETQGTLFFNIEKILLATA